MEGGAGFYEGGDAKDDNPFSDMLLLGDSDLFVRYICNRNVLSLSLLIYIAFLSIVLCTRELARLDCCHRIHV